MIMKKKLLINGILAGVVMLSTSVSQAEVIFEENFDGQPDWDLMTDPSTSSIIERQAVKDHLIPIGWDLVRSEAKWSPMRGHPDRHEAFEIKSEDSSKARGDKGKAMVNWRDSHDPGWNRFNSDGILVKKVGDQKQLYVEFYVAFSPEMYATFASGGLGSSKLFRIYSFTGGWDQPFNYFNGTSHPEIVWNVYGSPKKYGLRNQVTTLGMHNDSSNYIDMPDGAGSSSGTHSLSYISHLAGQAPNGGDAKLRDKLNGGFMLPGSGNVTMERLFGPPGAYTKVAFFVKMNSDKGVHDGVLTQWIDDIQILHTDTINWVPEGKPGRFWNMVAFGGNDFFQAYPNEDRHEEWYAIDDIKISTDTPDYLTTDSKNTTAPNPPLDIGVK